MRVYLDHNASVPLRPEARDAMIAAMHLPGNPSSVHAEGRAARAVVEAARAKVAALVMADRDEVTFTGSATEAAVSVLRQGWPRVLASDLCHDCIARSVSVGADTLPAADLLMPDDATLERCLSGTPGLLAIPAADGETGIRSAYQVWGHEARARGWRVLLDATQLVGRGIWFNFSEGSAVAEADYAILSAHKIGGPKGVGALLKRAEAPWSAVLTGGGQERGTRSGTENVPAIAGFGAAAEAILSQPDDPWPDVARRRDRLEATLEAACPDTISVGKDESRLPNTLCITTPGWRGETQVIQLDLEGYAVSAGSACSSGKVGDSRVLRALGMGDLAGCAIRISLGPDTTDDEVAGFAATWNKLLRRRTARAA